MKRTLVWVVFRLLLLRGAASPLSAPVSPSDSVNKYGEGSYHQYPNNYHEVSLDAQRLRPAAGARSAEGTCKRLGDTALKILKHCVCLLKWQQAPFRTEIALYVSRNGTVAEVHFSCGVRTSELVVSLNQMLYVSTGILIGANCPRWRTHGNLFRCGLYVDSLRLHSAWAVDRNIPRIIGDRNSPKVVDEDLREEPILLCLKATGNVFVDRLHFRKSVHGVELRLRVDYLMVLATQQDEVGKGVPIILRLRGIEPRAASVPSFNVADFTSNGASTLNDGELASGIGADIPG
jgi:hypothetical protein